MTTLNISSFDTTNVVDMAQMFHNCYSLTSLDLSGFNTSNVTDMSNMFYFCSAITNLDLSSFDTSSVTNMNYMFDGCVNLNTLTLSDDFSFNGSGSTRFYTRLNNGNSTHVGWKNASGTHFDVKDTSNANFIPNNVAATYTWDDDYVVTYHSNFGTDTTSTQTFNYGTAENLDENPFTRTGYTFLGWSADPNATTATYEDEASVTNVNNIQIQFMTRQPFMEYGKQMNLYITINHLPKHLAHLLKL